VIVPNRASLSLKHRMPATHPARAVGFNDRVNRRLIRVWGNALLLSTFSAGVQFSQVPSLVKASRTRLPGTVLDGAVGRSWGRRRPS
jgi:type IV secretory pathway VirB10-like protein